MMKRERRFARRLTPSRLESLERRIVLANLTAVWVGQDASDYVGPWLDLKPSTIQDVRITLNGLSPDKTVTKAIIGGYGADLWEYGSSVTYWRANMVRTTGSTSADLYFEPSRRETGRQFYVALTYADGSFQDVYFAGGTADPALKMPGQGLTGLWLGATAGVDLTHPSALVGPDGVTDLQIRINMLDPVRAMQAIDITDASGVLVASWGNNPSRAGTLEFQPGASGSRSGVITFSKPDRDMIGPLKIQVRYKDGSSDSTTVEIGSTQTAQVSLPTDIRFSSHSAIAQWDGQVVADPSRPGWVRVEVGGMPAGSAITAWQIDDSYGQTWLWTGSGTSSPWATAYLGKPLVVSQDASGKWFLEFDTRWDQSGRTLSIMAATASGAFYRMEVVGGTVDTARRSPSPATSEVIASPGMNLQALLDTYGTVRLSDGVYRLTEQLVLTRPVKLIGSGAAVLQFDQPDDSAGWSTVIKLAAGNITLSGFKIEFDGRTKWLPNIRYGPAIIGSPDNYDWLLGRTGPMAGIVIENLDITAPVANFADEEAPRTIRLIDDVSGRISGNRIFGGVVEVTGGPWQVVSNRNDGTPQGTFRYDTFAFHNVQGLELTGNVVIRGANSGPSLRFLMINGDSAHILVADNVVVGMGATSDDSGMIQNSNAHEVILTEAYAVGYEGALFGIDETRRIVRVAASFGRPYQPGDTVAVLTGAGAGTYRQIVNVLNGTTLVLDAPLPDGVAVGAAVSVNRGISDLTIRDNQIDLRNRWQSRAIVLVGNLYDTNVMGNQILGGLRAVEVHASPSESVRDWGWTRNVVFGLDISNNEFTDVHWFNQIGVTHDPVARANYGRLYLDGDVEGNVLRWSERFLIDYIWQEPGQSDRVLPGFELGEGVSWDAAEMQLRFGTNFIGLPSGWSNRPAVWGRSGTVNGNQASGEVLFLTPLPTIAAPSGLRLINDSGVNSSDGITNDARIQLDSVSGLTYRYRLAGDSNWKTVEHPSGFLPAGLMNGLVTIEVMAVDAYGFSGPSSSLSFVLDTVAPIAPTGMGRIGNSSVGWSPSVSTDVAYQAVRLSNSSGIESQTLAAAVNITAFQRWRIDTNRIQVVAVDLAGNMSAPLVSEYDYAPSGTWGGQDGSDYAALTILLRKDGLQDVRLDISGLPYGASVSSLILTAFGGGEWTWPYSRGRQFAAYWMPAADGLTGRIYFQTNRREIGRPFFVSMNLTDGTSVGFWVTGGTADPNLKVPPASEGARMANVGIGGSLASKAGDGATKKGAAAKAVRPAPRASLRASLVRSLVRRGY